LLDSILSSSCKWPSICALQSVRYSNLRNHAHVRTSASGRHILTGHTSPQLYLIDCIPILQPKPVFPHSPIELALELTGSLSQRHHITEAREEGLYTHPLFTLDQTPPDITSLAVPEPIPTHHPTRSGNENRRSSNQEEVSGEDASSEFRPMVAPMTNIRVQTSWPHTRMHCHYHPTIYTRRSEMSKGTHAYSKVTTTSYSTLHGFSHGPRNRPHLPPGSGSKRPLGRLCTKITTPIPIEHEERVRGGPTVWSQTLTSHP